MEKSFLSHVGTTILALILIFALVDSAAADADLEPSYARISGGWPDDDTFHPGDDIRIRLRVTNIGDETSDNFTVYYYIDGYSLGSESFSRLAPGEFNGFCYGSFTLPSEIPYGEYSVRVEVSCSNDTNPDNNEDSGDRSFIYAEKPLSDLEALDVSDTDAPGDGIYHPGEGIELTGYVINHSDENSNDFTIEFYVGGYSVGSVSPFGLDPGETYDRARMFSLPSDIPDGNHTLRIEISCPNDGTPNNNESVGAEITVAEKGPPDLYFTNFTASSGPFYAGHPATFICRIENAGHSTSDTYTLDFYIGGDNVGSEDCSGIEGHGEEWFDTTITLPYNLPAGVHDIDVEISCPDDLDPGNNSASTQLTVGESALPEISIQSVEATEGIYKPGDSITVRIRIECGTGQLAGDVEVDFYASADRVISDADYKIQSTGFGNLEPGESYTLDTTCRFPSDVPDGDYYIGIIVTYPDSGDNYHDRNPVWVSPPMDPAVQTVRATAGTYGPGDE
ncbi:MAG: CARDB domain-containing protein, partial [Planctomycetota bacterium]